MTEAAAAFALADALMPLVQLAVAIGALWLLLDWVQS